jgi:hypothetical protein
MELVSYRARILEDKVQRRIFELREIKYEEDVKYEVHNMFSKRLRNLYFLPNTIGAMKWKKMSWEGYVARMEEIRNAHKIVVGKPERKRSLEDLGVGGMIILKCIFFNYGVKMWLGLNWLWIGSSGKFL